MANCSFDDGYRNGWETIAGNVPPPALRTCVPAHEWGRKPAFQLGFEYGRVDALEWFSRKISGWHELAPFLEVHRR